LWENSKDAVNYNEKVVTPIAKPFKPRAASPWCVATSPPTAQC
jgi:hypothetical protein